MKYLDIYYGWHADKCAYFMCHFFGKHNELFTLFVPTEEELEYHIEEGYGYAAWGVKDSDASYTFTDLRQNIILLMAAMNNEL
jgi:hypothetical protein